MTGIEKLEVRLQDSVESDLREMFIPRVGRDGRLRYWMKCVLLGMTIYLVGGIGAALSNTLIQQGV